MTEPEPVKQLKGALNILSNIALLCDMPGDFDGVDLVNILSVLQYVAHSLAWKNPAFAKLTFEQRCQIAAETGKNLRQTLTLFTGIDPHNVIDASPSFNWPETIEMDETE